MQNQVRQYTVSLNGLILSRGGIKFRQQTMKDGDYMDIEDRALLWRFCPCLYYKAVFRHVKLYKTVLNSTKYIFLRSSLNLLRLWIFHSKAVDGNVLHYLFFQRPVGVIRRCFGNTVYCLHTFDYFSKGGVLAV